jgi:secreted trypsin-like serine protease
MCSKSKVRRLLSCVSSIGLVAAFLTVLNGGSSQAIDGGTAANGNPYGLRIWREVPTDPGWFSYTSCSAGLLKPRVIVTNAHCLKRSNAEGLNPSIYVIYPPGVNVTATPTTFTARQIFVRPDFNYESGFIAPDDIAFLVSDRDIGPQALSGIASRDEVDEFIKNRTPLAWYGYGTSVSSKTTNDPRSAIGVATSFARANDISFGPPSGQPSGRPCPGDSGSPVIAQNALGQQVLVGVHAGSSPRCEGNSGGSWSATGPIVSGYVDLLDQAYAAAGYPLLPSAPLNVRVQSTRSGTVVDWQAPARNESSVNTYRVFDGPTQLCEVPASSRSCSLGSLKFTDSMNLRVQALNAMGDSALSARVSAETKQSQEASGRVSGTYADPPLLNSKKSIIFCYNPKTKKTKSFKRMTCPEGWSTSQAAASAKGTND